MADSQNAVSLARSFDAEARQYEAITSDLGNLVYERAAETNLSICLSGRRFKNVLDAGGGIGKWVPFLCEHAAHVELMDISPESIRLAQKALGTRYPQVTFSIGNLEKAPYPTGMFDFVFAQGCVISYTPNPEALLAEFHRLLAPGGALWLDAYNSVGWAMECADLQGKLYFGKVEKDLIFRMPDWDYAARMFRPGYLLDIIRKAAFQPVSEYGFLVLANSLSLSEKGAIDFDRKLAEDLCALETELARDVGCRGTGKNYGVLAIRK